MREREFVYDLFITYSPADGGLDWIKALIGQLAKLHSEVSPRSLRLLLDETSIRSMDDWENRILVGLRSAKLMLAIVGRIRELAEIRRLLSHERVGSVVVLLKKRPHFSIDWQAAAGLNRRLEQRYGGDMPSNCVQKRFRG